MCAPYTAPIAAEQPTALAVTVAVIIAPVPGCARKAVKDCGEEEACKCCPGECKGFDPDVGGLVGGAEGVAALDESCAVP